MTVLDVIAKYRPTEKVFKALDGQAGVCVCCAALFDRLDVLANRFDLDLETLMTELEAAARNKPATARRTSR